MKKVGSLWFVLGCFLFVASFNLMAQDPDPVVAAPVDQISREELAKITEEACAATSGEKPTAEMIIKKVEEACEILTKEGKKAFSQFMGKDSKFLFAGTYIWIHNLEGIMLMHPIKFKLEGTPLLIFKDKNGKRFFVEMNKVAEEKGSGWVDYLWPIPGSKEIGRKVSFVKYCETPEKDKLVVGCGIYGMADAEIEKLVSGN
ncbi:MAG: cache domain-containing protein [Candidatus Rifleibacteriota bacterium]